MYSFRFVICLTTHKVSHKETWMLIYDNCFYLQDETTKEIEELQRSSKRYQKAQLDLGKPCPFLAFGEGSKKLLTSVW